MLFSTFLMWLLADLFHELPEVGDLDKPKLVFFFDEAHLLFNDASKAFLDAVTQTVRLIRSKGVGIFFVTQNPTDVPDAVLGQLGNRVQHALRAFTPDDAAALAKAVKTYPKTEGLRPVRGAAPARHRRGGRHRAGRVRCADAGGLDPPARAALVDGPDRPGGPGSRRWPASPLQARSTGRSSIASRPTSGLTAKLAPPRGRGSRRSLRPVGAGGAARLAEAAPAAAGRLRGHRRRTVRSPAQVVRAHAGSSLGREITSRAVRHPQALTRAAATCCRLATIGLGASRSSRAVRTWRSRNRAATCCGTTS